jgi:hypothetical protein
MNKLDVTKYAVLFMFRAPICLSSGVKGKAFPLQALTGPEGSRRMRFPDFKTIGT